MKKKIAVLMAALLVVATGYAGSISMNFTENPTNQIFDGGQNIGPLNTDSATWNHNSVLAEGSEYKAGTQSNLIDGTGAVTPVSVTWLSSNTWWNADGTGDDQAKLAVGYLDDGATSTGVGLVVTFENIPYAQYRVYGLTASDQNQYTEPFTYQSRNFNVNGAWVYDGGETVTALAYACIWDNNENNGQYWTPLIPGSNTAGNYWTIVTSGSTLTISGLPRNDSERGSLSAVIIEEIPEPATMMLLALGGLVLRRKHS